MCHTPDGNSMNFMTFSLLLCETGIIGSMFQMRKTRPERLSNLPRVIQSWGQDSNPAIWLQSPCLKNQNIMGRAEFSFDTPSPDPGPYQPSLAMGYQVLDWGGRPPCKHKIMNRAVCRKVYSKAKLVCFLLSPQTMYSPILVGDQILLHKKVF